MKKLIVVLCLVPSLAFAEETILKFKDGSAPMCGKYVEKGNQYCRNMSAGEMCWQKADVLSAKTVEACEDNGGFGVASQGSGGNGTGAPSSEYVDGKKGSVKADPVKRAEWIKRTNEGKSMADWNDKR